jgi:hypothetical protein
MREGGKFMRNSWVMFLVIVLMGFFAATAYAGPQMVIVLNPDNAASVKCYKADVSEQNKGKDLTGVTLSNVGECGVLEKDSKDQQIGIKKQGDSMGKNHQIVDVPNHTVIYSHSPGCVTYWYGGRSYTVCN